MSGQFNDIAHSIRDAIEIVGIVVIPVVLSLLIVDVVRRRRHEQPTARGFEVQPAPPPAHNP